MSASTECTLHSRIEKNGKPEKNSLRLPDLFYFKQYQRFLIEASIITSAASGARVSIPG